jgi:hypothetical protein
VEGLKLPELHTFGLPPFASDIQKVGKIPGWVPAGNGGVIILKAHNPVVPKRGIPGGHVD